MSPVGPPSCNKAVYKHPRLVKDVVGRDWARLRALARVGMDWGYSGGTSGRCQAANGPPAPCHRTLTVPFPAFPPTLHTTRSPSQLDASCPAYSLRRTRPRTRRFTHPTLVSARLVPAPQWLPQRQTACRQPTSPSEQAYPSLRCAYRSTRPSLIRSRSVVGISRALTFPAPAFSTSLFSLCPLCIVQDDVGAALRGAEDPYGRESPRLAAGGDQEDECEGRHSRFLPGLDPLGAPRSPFRHRALSSVRACQADDGVTDLRLGSNRLRPAESSSSRLLTSSLSRWRTASSLGRRDYWAES